MSVDIRWVEINFVSVMELREALGRNKPGLKNYWAVSKSLRGTQNITALGVDPRLLSERVLGGADTLLPLFTPFMGLVRETAVHFGAYTSPVGDEPCVVSFAYKQGSITLSKQRTTTGPPETLINFYGPDGTMQYSRFAENFSIGDLARKWSAL